MKTLSMIAMCIALAPTLALADSKTYQCKFDNSGQTITIKTNTDAYGKFNENRFTISTPGLFAEFSGMDFDLAVCNYNGVNEGESLENGVHCTSQSMGGGYDYESPFVFRTNESQLSKNPMEFDATLESKSATYDLVCQ